MGEKRCMCIRMIRATVVTETTQSGGIPTRGHEGPESESLALRQFPTLESWGVRLSYRHSPRSASDTHPPPDPPPPKVLPMLMSTEMFWHRFDTYGRPILYLRPGKQDMRTCALRSKSPLNIAPPWTNMMYTYIYICLYTCIHTNIYT